MSYQNKRRNDYGISSFAAPNVKAQKKELVENTVLALVTEAPITLNALTEEVNKVIKVTPITLLNNVQNLKNQKKLFTYKDVDGTLLIVSKEIDLTQVPTVSSGTSWRL